MDGGRVKWEREGRPMTREVPSITQTKYTAPPRKDAPIRAFRDRGAQARQEPGPARRRAQPRGVHRQRMHMPDYPNEGALRGGHIPGAKSIPWGRADQSRRRHVQDRQRNSKTCT